MNILHDYDLANKVYDFIHTKYTIEELEELLIHSNIESDAYIDMIRYQYITEEMFIKYIDKFKNYVTLYASLRPISQEMIIYLYDNNLLKENVIEFQKLEIDTIEYILSYETTPYNLYINNIVKSQTLSEEFFLKHADIIDYKILCKYQTITESFAITLENHTNIEEKKYDIYTVGAIYQYWSDDFVKDHWRYNEWFSLYIYPERIIISDKSQVYGDYYFFDAAKTSFLEEEGVLVVGTDDRITPLPYEIRIEGGDDNPGIHGEIRYIDTLLMDESVDVDNLYDWPILSNPEEARPLIVNTKNVTKYDWYTLISSQYLVHEYTTDYFVGYMVVDTNNYDYNTFIYKYDDGNTYERLSDMSYDTKGFGFKLISLEEATHLIHDYSGGNNVRQFKIKLVKVNYEDIAYAAKKPEGYVIRVNKLTVLNDN